MSRRDVFAAALQFPISMDISSNVSALERLIEPLPNHTLVVAPEGALSGYLPQPAFVERIDIAQTRRAIEAVATLCQRRKIHIVAGVCIMDEGGAWRNRSVYCGPDGERKQ